MTPLAGRVSARQQPPLALLLSEPSRFTFDAAVAIMMRASGQGRPGDAIRFQAAIGLSFVPSDVLSVGRNGPGFQATIGFLGLTGPGGVLARRYTELVNVEHRRRSGTLGQFLDVIAQRPIAHFAAAGIKYRPHRAADAAAIATGAARAPRDGLRDILLAIAGYATEAEAKRLAIGPDPLMFYAGAFGAHPRSADQLSSILSDWLHQAVSVEQFAGCWLALDSDQMSRLGSGPLGQFSQLGVDAAIGARAWDIQSRIVIHVGPLGLAAFEALMPGQATLARMVSLARAYVSCDIAVAVNPVLAADAVPPIALAAPASTRLGWNSWLPTGGKRRRDAADAVFEASSMEDRL